MLIINIIHYVGISVSLNFEYNLIFKCIVYTIIILGYFRIINDYVKAP